jgi:hypothetical protein
MLSARSEYSVSSVDPVQHTDRVANAHVRRVDHRAQNPRESYVGFTTLERAF